MKNVPKLVRKYVKNEDFQRVQRNYYMVKL
jgi:hypothetical protein